MKHIFSFVSITLILFVFSCKKDNSNKNNSNPGPSQPDISFNANEKKLAASDNNFGIEFFRNINSTAAKGENVMVSPLSVALALGMTYNGADSTTKTAMENTLYLNGMSVKDINESYKGLIDNLKSLDNNVVFNIANSIWYSNTFNVLQDFINTNQTYYYAQVTPLDFSQSSSADIINNWVAEKTNNKITKVIDNISPDNVLFLINAIYFKGIWKYQFDKTKTVQYTFHIDANTSKMVDMMNIAGDFNVYDDNNFITGELPYGNEQFSMLVVVPLQNNNIDDFIANMTNDKWNSIVNQMTVHKDFQISLPKFKFEYEKSLNDILTQMGMGIAFSNMADFTKINPGGGLFISDVKHKTFIANDEEGTEATAVTTVVVSNTSTYANQLIADRPFLFVIKERQTNAIMFIGRVASPEYSNK
jgi:serine protease inhibitor